MQSDRGPRINHMIRVPEVRLIDDLGEQVGVVSTQRALDMAFEAGLDLVEVSPFDKPPVCKILDYGKYKYDKQKKNRQAKAKAHQRHRREIRLRPRTEEHDFETKMKKAKEFLEAGDMVQFTIWFKGREINFIDSGAEMLNRAIALLDELGKPDTPPARVGNKVTVSISPRK
ncbi:MAG: translation initiation factor IF-3 [Planctomycetes bacterium]|nr:translation initiation factor IF-3 [Planctomycetota bacterium]